VRSAVPTVTALIMCLAASAQAQTLGPEFIGSYTILDLGTVDGVDPNYGGLVFDELDPNVLLLSGRANAQTAEIYALSVSRDKAGHVIGLSCEPPAFFSTAPGASGGIDGGLDFGPSGVLFYSTYSDNHIGQILPGSTAPDRLIDLSPLGIAASTGTLRFVPPGFAGAGRLKIASYNSGRWYDTAVAPAGDGTFDIQVSRGFVQLTGGPEGIVYIAGGNPGFANDSILLSRYQAGAVSAYEIDRNGDPIPETARVFISGLGGVEGAAIDPVTGDFFFSTFGGGNRVIRVSGFLAEAGCRSDLNGDGTVDGADLGDLLSAWDNPGGLGDLSGNCIVDGQDLGILLAEWGDCPQ